MTYDNQIYFQNWMCVWLNLPFGFFSLNFCVFSLFLKIELFFLKNPKNLFCPSQQKICCVSYKTSQEKRSTASEKNWAATIPKKERWEIVLQKISEIQLKKNQKIIIWGDRFLTIKARHGFKARNLMVKQNLGWAPHFLRWKQPKNHRKQKPMWLPVLKPSKNHKSRIRKSTSYTVIGWETKIADTLRLFTYHLSNGLKFYFCMSLLWHPCHNSVI